MDDHDPGCVCVCVCVCVCWGGGGEERKCVYIYIGMVSQCSEFKLHYFRERVCVCVHACVISNFTEVLPPCIPRI